MMGLGGAGLGVLWGGACLLSSAGLLLRGRFAAVLLALAVVLLGAGLWRWRVEHQPADAMARRLGDERTLVRLEGMVVTAAEPVRPERGALGGFIPAERRGGERRGFDLRVNRLVTQAGPERASGLVRVFMGEAGPAVVPGDAVRVLGFARAAGGPRNPGELDARAWSRLGAQVWLDAGEGGTVEQMAHAQGWQGLVRRWLDAPRATARRTLATALPVDDDARRLVRGLLLGEPDREGLAGAFRRIGLAHLLAVSGFHVSVMAAVAVLALRAGGDRGWLESALVAGALGVYLLIVPGNAPILRAGLMTGALLLSDALGRRHDRLALLGWVAALVLVLRPADLFSLGFQLSVGLVAWLLVLAEPRAGTLADREIDAATVPLWRVPLRWMGHLTVTTLGCWTVSLPLVLLHTGSVAPLAVPATLVVVPLIVLVMWLGFGLLLVGALVPALSVALGAVLGWTAGWCAQLVRWIDTLPGATVFLPGVSVWWAAGATVTAVYLWRRGRVRDGWSWALPLAAGLWLAAEFAHSARLPGDLAGRVTMLDVGDGSALLVQSPGAGLLWDVGSFRDSVGVRLIPDACRALGAPRVSTAIISHANIDHYAGLLDAAGPLGLETVMTGESFVRAAADADGPEAAVLSALARRGVRHRVLRAGDIVELDGARLEILHPPLGFVARAENDASLIARLELAGVSVLLTGDAQAEALGLLLQRRPGLWADVLELPHHGSAHEAAYELVRRLGPRVVLQSTGPSRLEAPRWDWAKPGRRWLVTAADGAVGVEVSADGVLRAGPVR
jgi:competence protein ComEC